MTTDVAVIILTYNEEPNIAQALSSVRGWAREVFVVDSFSTDRTLDVAGTFPCTVEQHAFEDYAKQRNWALDHLPIRSEWIFFLDADEWLPDNLKEEISTTIAANPKENGFFLRRRFIWMGRWIRRGYYPTWLLRMFRSRKGWCEERGINEHILVEGAMGYLQNDFIHEDRKGIGDWIAKHNGYAEREARELFESNATDKYMQARLFGTRAQRTRWMQNHIYNCLPVLLRPFPFFLYRFVLRGGFLDGKEAFIYHFLQGLWLRMLIDIKYLEMLRKKSFDAQAPQPMAASEVRQIQ